MTRAKRPNKEVVLTFRATERQAELFRAAAEEDRKTLSEWVRNLGMNRIARRMEEQHDPAA